MLVSCGCCCLGLLGTSKESGAAAAVGGEHCDLPGTGAARVRGSRSPYGRRW